MDGIFNKVKDAVVDKALGRDNADRDYNSERRDSGRNERRSDEGIGYSTHGNRRQGDDYNNSYNNSSRDTRGGYSREEGHSNYGGRSYEEERSGYGGQGGRSGNSRLEDDRYDSGRREQPSYGGRDEPRYASGREERGSGGYGGQGRQEERGYGYEEERHGYGGQGGRSGNVRPEEGRYDSGGRDHYRSQGQSGYGGGSSYEEERHGYGGQGGRSGNTRPEEDRYDSSSREYRPQTHSHEQYSGDYGEAREYARKHADDRDDSLFSTALSMLSGKEKKLEREDVDEQEYVRNYKSAYEDDSRGGQKSGQSLAQAAAMQALKMYTGKSGIQGAGKDQNAFIGLAMGEAVKLFDSQKSKGNVAPGENKQDVVSQAAQIALKLFLKSKVDASGGSGGSGLLSLASKFL